MKETAVQWLADKMLTEHHSKIEWDKIVDQAKAMEKEQHDKTAEEWWKEGAHYIESGGRAKWESFEQYYNETFIVP